MLENVLELQGIEKKYGNVVALDDFSLKMENGLYGLLGENGAGKSTLIKILTCNLSRDQGKILYNGKEVEGIGEEYRSKLGYLPQESVGYPKMKVGEFMEYSAALKGIKASRQTLKEMIIHSLERVHLEGEVRKQFGELSGGMKRRLLFAQATLGNPKILILDEPTAGLDPNERIAMRNLIATEALDKIVILATHIISDIECVADHIILMKKGINIGCRQPEEWMDYVKDKVWETVCVREQLENFQREYNVISMRQCKKGIILRVLSDDNLAVHGWESSEPGLEDVYLYFRDN